jgi:hypothetical protein
MNLFQSPSVADALRRDQGHHGGERLLSVHAVARACGVSVRTVYRWLGPPDGLPVHLLPGTGTRPILRVAQEDLDAFLARHRHDPEVVDAAKNRTFHLDGMRFMRPTSTESGKPELDTRRPGRPVCGPAGRRSP